MENSNIQYYTNNIEKVIDDILEKSILSGDIFDVLVILLLNRDVSLPISINYGDRLRLSYLICFLRADYHQVFQIINKFQENVNEICTIDKYFQCISAYLIGEPVNKIRSLAKSLRGLENNTFENIFNRIEYSVETNSYLDPYLLDIDTLDYNLEDRILSKQHDLVKSALEALQDPTSYDIPFTSNQIIGLLPQLLKSSVYSDQKLNYSVRELGNFENSIVTIKSRNDFEIILGNIREGIKAKIPYLLLLTKLMEKFDKENDPLIKHNLIILQAAVLFSERVDHNKGKSFGDKIATEILEGLIADGALSLLNINAFGLATAFSTTFNISKHLLERNRELRSKNIFDSLLREFTNVL